MEPRLRFMTRGEFAKAIKNRDGRFVIQEIGKNQYLIEQDPNQPIALAKQYANVIPVSERGVDPLEVIRLYGDGEFIDKAPNGSPIGDRVLQFTISTEDRDRDKDSVAVDGWKLKNYKKNPVVLWAHNYKDLPIAKSLDIWADESRLKSRSQFTEADLNPLGNTIYRMFKSGYLNAVSVGFIPLKFEVNEEESSDWWPAFDFKEQELLEYSGVPVPANPNALHEANAKGIDIGPIKDWAQQVLDDAQEGRPPMYYVSIRQVERLWAEVFAKPQIVVPDQKDAPPAAGQTNPPAASLSPEEIMQRASGLLLRLAGAPDVATNREQVALRAYSERITQEISSGIQHVLDLAGNAKSQFSYLANALLMAVHATRHPGSTIAQISQKTGIPFRRVLRILDGSETVVEDDQLKAFSEVLGLDLEDLKAAYQADNLLFQQGKRPVCAIFDEAELQLFREAERLLSADEYKGTDGPGESGRPEPILAGTEPPAPGESGRPEPVTGSPGNTVDLEKMTEEERRNYLEKRIRRALTQKLSKVGRVV